MLASVVAGLLGAVFGSAPGMIAAPKATTSLAFAAVLSQTIALGGLDPSQPDQARRLLTLAFATVVLSGATQFALGFARFGGLVKFIPYPVVAGIRNATAILLIYGQTWALLGVPRGRLTEILGVLPEAHVGALAVGLVTVLVAWRGGRWMPRATVPLAALLAGTALHYGLVLLPGVSPGPVLGALPSAVPRPEYLGDLLGLLISPDLRLFLPVVLAGALAIAVLESVTALIAMVGHESLYNRRFDANRQLQGQGPGSAVGAIFGGLPASGLTAAATANYRAGGRSGLSGVVNSLSVLVLIALLLRPLSFLPNAAIAGFILVVAVGLLDPWSLDMMKAWTGRGRRQRQDDWADLGAMALVLAVGIAFNLIAAVTAGVVVSILVFVGQMSRSPIRSLRSGEVVRSRRLRDQHVADLLREHGSRIAVLELEGTIFFGSCDPVATELEQLAGRGALYVVVDMKRVVRVDTSGYQALGQTYRRLRNRGVRMSFSYAGTAHNRPALTSNLLFSAGASHEDIFPNTDRALEECEEQLLSSLITDRSAAEAWAAHDFGLEMGLDEPQALVFASKVERREYEDGELVCGLGDPGDSMFFVSTGSADVIIPIGEGGRERRLATLTRGTLFGEMSLLDGRPRSADVRASRGLVCFEFTVEAMRELSQTRADVALRVYAALGRTLGHRLRDANDLIQELDQ